MVLSSVRAYDADISNPSQYRLSGEVIFNTLANQNSSSKFVGQLAIDKLESQRYIFCLTLLL